MTQLNLFAAMPVQQRNPPAPPAPGPYAGLPGFKGRQTSRAAAVAMADKAPTLRDRVLAAIRAKPRSPEELAADLKEPVMNIRPRCSELAKRNLIANSGERREAQGGRRAIVWKVVQP